MCGCIVEMVVELAQVGDERMGWDGGRRWVAGEDDTLCVVYSNANANCVGFSRRERIGSVRNGSGGQIQSQFELEG